MTPLLDHIPHVSRAERHRPCPRATVGEVGWAAATNLLASGHATLFGLWGDAGAVHMALLGDGSDLVVLTLDCPDGSYPSVGQKHPPAIRPERAIRSLFGLDAVGYTIARGLVGNPRQAEQGLVEMDVAVDQRRQDQCSAEVEDMIADIAVDVAGARHKGGDPPFLDVDISSAAIGQRGVGDQHAITCRRPRPLPCGSGRRLSAPPWPSGRCRWRW